jgi:uncharacterized protein YeeX (DUF496 family)
MEQTQAIPDWKTTADEIWAVLRETARKQEETAREMEETDRRMKETDKRLGELTNRFGDMVEYMVMPHLVF